MKKITFVILAIICATTISVAQKSNNQQGNKKTVTKKGVNTNSMKKSARPQTPIDYNNMFKKGDNLFNIGIGVNSYYGFGIPIGASYEKGISDVLSVGVNFDYLHSHDDYIFGSDNYDVMYFGGRVSYHVNELFKINVPKLDVYGGGTIGYRSFSWSQNIAGTPTGDNYGNGIYFGGFIGGKYYFTKTTAGLVELGAIGSTNARIGLGFRF